MTDLDPPKRQDILNNVKQQNERELANIRMNEHYGEDDGSNSNKQSYYTKNSCF